MHTGKVSWYNREKGFGRIEQSGVEAVRVFVHHKAIVAPTTDRTDDTGTPWLEAGDEVEYEVIDPNDRGPRAQNLRVTKEAPPKKENV